MYCHVWETVQIQSQRQYNKWESHGLIIGRISGPQRQTEDHTILKERKEKKKKTTMCAKKESLWKGRRSAERRMCENHATNKLQTTHKKL